MYEKTRWDAAKRQLWIKTTPDGEWWLASADRTIEYLAEQLAYVSGLLDDASSRAA